MSENAIQWEAETQKQFQQMLEKIPIFMRPIAKDKVTKAAEEMVRRDNRSVIEEKDMVDAFFEATPFGFHGPMKCDMEDLGIDYQKYGHER